MDNGNVMRKNFSEEEKKKYAEEKQQQMDAIMQKLENGVQAIYQSENYENFLKTMGKFHNYSLNNMILISSQNPNATLVAGYDSWSKKFGRFVKKGEKGIKILVPAPYKKKVMQDVVDEKTGQVKTGKDGMPMQEETEIEVPGFKIATVFDIEQTYGPELPTLGVSELSGSVEKYEDLMIGLRKASPVSIVLDDISGGAKGYFSASEHMIHVQKGMSEIQTIKTMVHEIAHAICHDTIQNSNSEKKTDISRGKKELEAESISYVVCQKLGIDSTGDYSFGYIAGWSGDKSMEDLKGSLSTIKQASSKIIDSVERVIWAREKARSEEFEKSLSSVSSKRNEDSVKRDNKAEEFMNLPQGEEDWPFTDIPFTGNEMPLDAVCDKPETKKSFKEQLQDAKQTAARGTKKKEKTNTQEKKSVRSKKEKEVL